MPDREKVIMGLECCQDGCNSDCPYWTSPFGSASICRSEMERDVLALLKAQENEIEELKQEIEGHKDNLRETLDEMMRYADELKAREPRVLRVEEVVLLKQNDAVWLEDYNKKDVIPAIVSCMGPMVICIEFALSDRFISVGYDDYGKRWRCWTSCPTDEQREAVKWE